MPSGRRFTRFSFLLFVFRFLCPAEGLLNLIRISGECGPVLGGELWFFEDGGGIGEVDQCKFFAAYNLQALVGHGGSERENLEPAALGAWRPLPSFPHILGDQAQSVREPRCGVEKFFLWARAAKCVQALSENASKTPN